MVVLSRCLLTHALLLHPRCEPPVAKGPPPIKSRYFVPLGSPANYTELIAAADGTDAISVIKFQAPFCRTCRATSPLLDRVAKDYPQAKYYSMDLVRNGKAAGERMNKFFRAKSIKLSTRPNSSAQTRVHSFACCSFGGSFSRFAVPYIEIYQGAECIHTEVTPPSALAAFEQAMGAAVERVRAASSSRGGASRQLVLLRQLLREKREELLAATALGRGRRRRRSTSGPRGASADADEAGEARRLFAPPPWRAQGPGAPVQSGGAPSSGRPPQQAPAAGAARKRGAPLRGATGGRRKGWR